MKLFYLLTNLKTISRYNSVNGQISASIIEMLIRKEEINIFSLSKKANVSLASISIFTKYIGYDSFKVLKNDINKIKKNFGYDNSIKRIECNFDDKNYSTILDKEKKLISKINSYNLPIVFYNAKDMLLKSPEIILLGYPRPSNSYFLDMELSYKGVVCYSFINPIDQKEVIKKHKNATLVIFDLDNDKNTVSYILESADTDNKIICFSQQEIMNTGLNKIMFLLNEKYLQDKMLECEIMISRLVKLIRYSNNNNYQ